MNRAILLGRLTRDPDIRQTAGENPQAMARYTLAVDRRAGADGKREADFIQCVAFGKAAEFAQKYFTQGLRVAVDGRIRTGSYTDRDGKKIYTTDVVIENQEFADGKKDGSGSGRPSDPQDYQDDFLPADDGAPFR